MVGAREAAHGGAALPRFQAFVSVPPRFRVVARASLGVLLGLCAVGCAVSSPAAERDPRADMRAFVHGIGSYARQSDPQFIVIPQNGQELLTADGDPQGPKAPEYVAVIDGVGREDLFYGFEADDVATSAVEREYLLGFLAAAASWDLVVLVTDYCATETSVDDSYQQNASSGFLSFAADSRELDRIPSYPAQPPTVHTGDVSSLAEARNFLYLLNPAFPSKAEYLAALGATNHDVLIVDAFYDENPLSVDDVEVLSRKANGGRRLVISYLSIGEAEDYRYYWQDEWAASPPPWLEAENPDWPGNYTVRYWVDEWQRIIYGTPDSYLDMTLSAGFDGVYLDIVDAFERFE